MFSHILVRCCLMLLLSSFSLAVIAKDVFPVTFVSPNPPTPGFWLTYEQVMIAAAKQLDIDLRIVNAKAIDRFSYIDAFDSAVNDPVPPDYVVTLFRHNATQHIIDTLQNKQIKLFSSNSALPDELQKNYGEPRSTLPFWIGQMSPNDYYAGVLLARTLTQQARRAGASSDTVYVGAITGSRDSPVSFARAKGLSDFALSSNRIEVSRLMYSDWYYKTARTMSNHILTRFPEVTSFWCASDEIAKAVIDQIKLDRDIDRYDIASIDWSKKGIESYKAGELLTSVGGHFMEGALILALLRDYHDGIDFKDRIGVNTKMEMDLLTAHNIQMVEEIIINGQYERLDFTKVSESISGLSRYWSDNYVDIMSHIYQPTTPKEMIATDQ